MLFFVLYLVLHYLMSVSVPKMAKFEQILDRKLTPLLAKRCSEFTLLFDKYEEIKGKGLNWRKVTKV
jgi:hypothetical protein